MGANVRSSQGGPKSLLAPLDTLRGTNRETPGLGVEQDPAGFHQVSALGLEAISQNPRVSHQAYRLLFERH